MFEEFKNSIKIDFSHLLEKPFLLACSGGIDSVVLAHLFSQLKADFAIAHCNFKLRGAESDTDEKFVHDLTDKIGYKYYVTHFNTNNYVLNNKVSVQMAARQLRYQWFNDLMAETKYKILVTGHQADDNLETFLINLSRGTGIDGLTGIPPKTKTITRPLLNFTRVEIEAYAKANNIKWREDASNSETKYLRNKIRHDIVPLLKELHPTFLENFKNTTEYLGHSAVLAKKHTELTKKKLFKNNGDVIKIDVKEIEKLNPLKAYLYPLFNEYGFTEWKDVEGLLTAMSGKEVRSKTHRLLKDREYLLLQTIANKDENTYAIVKEQKLVEKPISLNFTDVSAIKNPSENSIFVDKDLLEYPLMLRKWKEGDVFYPSGMLGKKKLSKYYKDEKFDVFSKESQWLLCSGDQIVWVVGKRADRRFTVTEKTQNIMCLRFLDKVI